VYRALDLWSTLTNNDEEIRICCEETGHNTHHSWPEPIELVTLGLTFEVIVRVGEDGGTSKSWRVGNAFRFSCFVVSVWL
jgi:hypothetical protein